MVPKRKSLPPNIAHLDGNILQLHGVDKTGGPSHVEPLQGLLLVRANSDNTNKSSL